MEIIGFLLAILVGVSLGLIGSGGSILTVPILVYLFNVNPVQATSYSLFVVGTTALVGTLRHYKIGNLEMKSVKYFALPSVASMLFIRKVILHKIPQHLFYINRFDVTKDILVMVVFALLMIAASSSMILKNNLQTEQKQTSFLQLSIIGLLVGLVTGFLGAGGGFLIIPALLFFAGLPMKKAVGTSLFIIFINSIIGFASDVIIGLEIDYKLLFMVSAFAIVGMFMGTTVSKKIDGAKLKPAFGWFILAMGVFIIIKETILKP
jgi:uncharacterized membrane protein YfcA